MASSETGIKHVTLRRNFGLITGCSFVIGTIIGSGIFVSPQGVVVGAGSYGLSLVIWALAGLISLCSSLAYAEMASIIPKAGSTFNYLKEVYGDGIAFVFLFTTIFCLRTSSHAAVAKTCSEYLLAIFFNAGCLGPPEVISKALTTCIIVLCGAINVKSSTLAANVSVIFTATKLSALAVIILGGLFLLTQDYRFKTQLYVYLNISVKTWKKFRESVANSVEELKNPERNIPLVIFISLPLVTIVYILTNISYFTVLSPDELISSVAVAVTWAKKVIPSLYWFAPLAVSLSTFGSICIVQLIIARVIFAAAREKHLPEVLSMLHINTHIPVPAVVMHVFLTTCYVFMGTINELIAYSMSVALLFQAMVGAGVIILRFNGKLSKKHFKAPLICPITLIVAALFMFVVPLIGDPQWGHLFVMLIILLAVITWFIFLKQSLSIPGTDTITLWSQMIFKVVPADPIQEDANTHDINTRSNLTRTTAVTQVKHTTTL